MQPPFLATHLPELRQRDAQGQLSGHIGQWVARGFTGQGRAAGEPGVHLDDIILQQKDRGVGSPLSEREEGPGVDRDVRPGPKPSGPAYPPGEDPEYPAEWGPQGGEIKTETGLCSTQL